LHHGLKVNLISIIKVLQKDKRDIFDKKILPKIIPEGGLQSIFERLWKRLRVTNKVNDRALFAYLSNKSIGYDIWDSDCLLTPGICLSLQP
jgi:hypothetical protein